MVISLFNLLYLIGLAMLFIGIVFWEDRIKDVAKLFSLSGFLQSQPSLSLAGSN